MRVAKVRPGRVLSGSLLLAAASLLTLHACATPGPGNADARGDGDPPPTFAHNVAHILRENCVGCHHPGGPGPFSLVAYDSARSRAGKIAEATTGRIMPPWPPRDEPGPSRASVG